MGWRLSKRDEPRQKGRPNAAGRAAPDDAGELFCSQCGAPLGFDREDERDGDGPGRHLCGECNRARNFDVEVEMLWDREGG